jgi:hypothetical protein
MYAHLPFMIDISCEIWTPSVAFICSLGFRFKGVDSAQRRSGFPSWSWCGWDAPIDGFPWDPSGYTEQYFSREHHAIDSRVEVELELLDGERLSLDAYSHMDPLTRQSQLSQYITITVPTTPILMKASRTGVEIQTQSSRRYLFTIKVADHRKIQKTGLIIHIMSGTSLSDPERHRYPIVLVVGEIDGVWERLGIYDLRIPGYDSITKQLQTLRLG